MCLLFFQLALLVGYAYAYAVTLPFPVSRQVQVQLAILAASLLLLPITPADSWKPQDVSDPTWRIVVLLAMCVGLPYVALAATTPLLSRWLATLEPSLDPVRIFAASNLGSFAGLLSYPFAFERLLSSQQQTRWWSWADVLYAALFAACGLITMRHAAGEEKAAEPGFGAEIGQRRSVVGVDRAIGARVRPAAGHDQCDHAMVGGSAVPVPDPTHTNPDYTEPRIKMKAKGPAAKSGPGENPSPNHTFKTVAGERLFDLDLLTGDGGTNGSRNGPRSMPKRLIAHLTGMGLVVINSALKICIIR